jgi:hypothetical protein
MFLLSFCGFFLLKKGGAGRGTVVRPLRKNGIRRKSVGIHNVCDKSIIGGIPYHTNNHLTGYFICKTLFMANSHNASYIQQLDSPPSPSTVGPNRGITPVKQGHCIGNSTSSSHKTRFSSKTTLKLLLHLS